MYSPYDEVGALGGLFAPAYIANDPVSRAAVDRWNAAHLKRRPAPDPWAKATGTPGGAIGARDAVTQALMDQESMRIGGQSLPDGIGGESGGGLSGVGETAAPGSAASPGIGTSATGTSTNAPASAPASAPANAPAAAPPAMGFNTTDAFDNIAPGTISQGPATPAGTVTSAPLGPVANAPAADPAIAMSSPQTSNTAAKGDKAEQSQMQNTPFGVPNTVQTISVQPTDPVPAPTPPNTPTPDDLAAHAALMAQINLAVQNMEDTNTAISSIAAPANIATTVAPVTGVPSTVASVAPNSAFDVSNVNLGVLGTPTPAQLAQAMDKQDAALANQQAIAAQIAQDAMDADTGTTAPGSAPGYGAPPGLGTPGEDAGIGTAPPGVSDQSPSAQAAASLAADAGISPAQAAAAIAGAQDSVQGVPGVTFGDVGITAAPGLAIGPTSSPSDVAAFGDSLAGAIAAAAQAAATGTTE